MKWTASLLLTLLIIPFNTALAKDDILQGLDVEKAETRFHELLNLTEEQEEKLRALDREFMKTQIKMNAEIDVLKIDLEDQIESDKPDKRKIEKIIDEISQIRGEMMKARIHSLLEKKKVFTKEQWLKLKDLSKRKFMRMRRQKRGGRGGPGPHRGDFEPFSKD
jgi:Spy/CpxP family protein refolding chaperone